MKTAIVRISAVVLVPEEWPAKLSPVGEDGTVHDPDPTRTTHESLRLPGAVTDIVHEMMLQLKEELKTIHPEIELSGVQVQ